MAFFNYDYNCAIKIFMEDLALDLLSKKRLIFLCLTLRLLNAIIISRLSSFGNAHFLVHFSFSKYLMYFLLFQAKVYVSSSFFLSLFHKNFAKVKKIFVKIKPWDKKLTTFEYLLFAFPLSLKCN